MAKKKYGEKTTQNHKKKKKNNPNAELNKKPQTNPNAARCGQR